MIPESYADLAFDVQHGEHKALPQLLRLSHTPVMFLCRKILRNEQIAQALARDLLRSVPERLSQLEDPSDFEKWLCQLTASRCVQVLFRMQQDTPDDTTQPGNPPRIPAKYLDEVQTAQVVQQLVDDLPDVPRLCLLLYCCAGLKLKGISQLVELPEPEVLEHLNHAQKVVNNQLRKYHRMGVQFAPIPALSTLLRTSMYSTRDPKAAAAMVGSILEKPSTGRASSLLKKKSPIRLRHPAVSTPLLIAVIAAAVLLVLMIAAIVFLEIRHRQSAPAAAFSALLPVVQQSFGGIFL